MSMLPAPGPMSFAGNVSQNWKKWKHELDLFLLASGRSGKSEPVKIATLLHLIGNEGRDVYATFRFALDGEKDKWDIVIKKFEQFCNPRKNTVFHRYQMWQAQQKEGEPIDAYVTRLTNLAQDCEYGAESDFMIRDRIIFGIKDSQLKERLLRWEPTEDVPQLTLKRTVDICRATEATKDQIRQMTDGESEIAAIGVSQRQKPRDQRKTDKQFSQNTRKYTNPQKEQVCGKCNRSHAFGQCPAFGKRCHKCKRENHFAVCCRAGTLKFNKTVRTPPTKVRPKKVMQVEGDDSGQELFLGEVTVADGIEQVGSGDNTDKEWWETIQVNDQNLRCKLDTGAEVNVMPFHVYAKLKPKPALKATGIKLTTYGGQLLKPLGRMHIECMVKGENKFIDFVVVKANSYPLLGISTCQKLNLVRKVEEIKPENETGFTKDGVIKEYSDVFSGNGCFKHQIHLEVDHKVEPVVHPPRKVPFSLINKLKETLESMEAREIIKKVDYPTKWVNSLVIVHKPDGSLRVCLDPRDLNKALRRAHHKMPTAEDIMVRLAGMQYFSVIDMKEGFWNVPLDKESADLCTFNTPFGRYQFLRLPFGLNVSPEIFQRINEQLFGDIPNTGIVTDDFVIAGKSKDEHDQAMKSVLERARKENCRFNPEKIQWCLPKVKYLGRIISVNGITPDPDKINAINNMATPATRKEMKRLLGVVNFLSQFIPNFSEITAPLRVLLKNNVQWYWGHEQERAVAEIKRILSSEPVLGIFDQKQPIRIQADASCNGLGACLLQNGRPISYASKSLTEVEQRYAQIEKELLAIVFACTKFDSYIYGLKTTIETDHKPLLAIVNKPLEKLSPRLQRMVLKLQRYELELTYVPGSKLFLADTLSRAALQPNTETEKMELEADLNYVVHALSQQLQMSTDWRRKLQKEYEKEEESKILIQLVHEGLPEDKHSLHGCAKQYAPFISDLHIVDGMVCKGNAVFVPKTLRAEVLKLLHVTHLGKEKMMSRAKATVFWPNMRKDITEMCAQCSVCLTHRKRQTKEPMIMGEIPVFPWQRVAADLFYFKGKDYLLIVDYYSKYPEVVRLDNKTAESVINAMKIVFSRFGIPEQVMADNMPFGSFEFSEFAKLWGFTLTTSSPRYPQSNGLAERNVQTIKKMLKKSIDSANDVNLALLEFRNTPLKGMAQSPAELLMGRSLRSVLPTRLSTLQTKAHPSARKQLERMKFYDKSIYDKGSHNLKPLTPGDVVRLRTDDAKEKVWEPGVVKKLYNAPRSYLVQNNQGRILRRNRRHLLQTTEQPPFMSSSLKSEETDDDFVTDEGNAQRAREDVPLNDAERITRVGRRVVRPSYFKDYVLY